MRRFFLAALIIGMCGQTFAQTLGFEIPPEVCIGQNILANNTSVNINSEYYWDLCEGELLRSVVAQNSYTLPAVDQVATIKTVFTGSEYITLALDRTANRLYRLNHGGDFFQSPTVTSVITPATTPLISPQGMDVIQVDNMWHVFIANTGDSKIIRLDFGNSLLNEPASSTLDFSGHLNAPVEVEIAFESNKFYTLVANFSSNNLVVAELGNQIMNQPQPVFNVVALAGAANPYGFSLKSFNDGIWRGVVGSFSNNNFHTVSFANGLSQPPVVSNITSLLPVITRPVKMDLETWGKETVLTVMDLTGFIHRIQFGRGDLFNSVTSSDILNAAGFGESLSLSLFYNQGNWHAITFAYTTKKLHTLSFDNACGQVSMSYFTGETPPGFQMTASGIFDISLSSMQNGFLKKQTQEISVLNLAAPAINIAHDAICSQHDIIFTVISPDQLTQFNWEFGDGGISAQESPTYQYSAAGTYGVNLEAKAINGCVNNNVQTITIYNKPIANFTSPTASPLCTNQNLQFLNTTPVVGYLPTWQWNVNGVPVSTTQDLNYAFTSTTNQEVKLVAAIPGCESEKIINLNTIVVGPDADFTIAGQCEDSNIIFTNASSGTITGYRWNFGDSHASTQINPVNVYTNPGSYTVTLTASNAAGCNNTTSKQLTIYSVPQVNFTALAPPFSCNGTPTQFNDLTPPPPDSNLTSWLWDFGDTGSPSNASSQRNPQHTYAMASDYTVALTVTTNFSCSATLQKTVTIYQTPTATFTHSALCEDSGVAFSDAASTNQAWNWQIGSDVYFTEDAVHIFNTPGSYDVIFSVTGANNCVGSTSQTVSVPTKLNVDFSTLRNCVDQQTEFTELTNDTSDPITDVHWDFGGLGTASITPAIFTFPVSGTIHTTLTVTTQSGCSYPVTKEVQITPGPLAAFTAMPNAGEAPLPVQFINTSLNASTYTWKFNSGGASSVASSPVFMYGNEGRYTVELIATDANSCVDTTRQIIDVLEAAELSPPTPNPGTGAFTVEWRTPDVAKTTLTLVDAQGREIRTFEVMSTAGINRYTLDITGEQPGMYMLTIRYLNAVKTYRLMVSE